MASNNAGTDSNGNNAAASNCGYHHNLRRKANDMATSSRSIFTPLILPQKNCSASCFCPKHATKSPLPPQSEPVAFVRPTKSATASSSHSMPPLDRSSSPVPIPRKLTRNSCQIGRHTPKNAIAIVYSLPAPAPKAVQPEEEPTRVEKEKTVGIKTATRRKRFKPEEKQRLKEFADRIGWRSPRRHDQREVREFCSQIGIMPDILKNWINNNKRKMAGGSQSSAASFSTPVCTYVAQKINSAR